MAHQRIDIWALPRAGEALPLPDLRQGQFSPTDGDDGSIEITYPATGRNANLLVGLADSDTDLEIEITVRDTAGRRRVDRAILDEVDLDDVDETDMIVVRGRLLAVIFREVCTPYHPTGENGETPASGSAGTIARVLLQAAQGRGALVGVTWTFTDTHDSAGIPWAGQGNFSLSPGQTYSAMLGLLRGHQLAEHRLTATRVLLLHNPDGNGIDRTVGADPLTLERGRDLGDAPRRFRLRGAITTLLTSGKDGIYSSFADATALARRGRRIEGFKSFGNAADQGTLDALTQSQLGTQVTGRTEVSHKLALGPDHPAPLLDFDTSDYVYSATRRGVTRRRVRQITISFDENEIVSAAVTLGVLIDERAAAQQRLIDDLASGTAISGTSTPSPDVDNGSVPSAPTGLVVNSLSYFDGPRPLAQATAGWTAVTTNVGGGPVGDLNGYEVMFRYTAAQGLPTGWVTAGVGTATSLTWSSLAQGKGAEAQVFAVNRYGRRSAGSAIVAFTTALDGGAPPVLPAPAGSAYLGILKWDWDGKGSVGEAMPGDFREAELHLSTTSGFTPSRPLLAGTTRIDTATSTTYRDQLAGAGELPVDPGGAYGVTWYAKWVAVDQSNNASAASAQGSAVRVQAADGDVAELNVGKLRTGIMTALMTVSGIIRTSLTGAGWEMDVAGVRFYNAARVAVLEYIAATASLIITGTMQTGLTGRRVVVSGAANEIRFMPQVGETRFGYIRSYVPNNYPNDVAVDVSASDADTLDVVARLSVLPDQVQTGVQDQADNTRSWSRTIVQRTFTALQLFSSPGVRSTDIEQSVGLNSMSTRRVNQHRGTWIYNFDNGAGALSCRMLAGFVEDGGAVGDLYMDNNSAARIGLSQGSNRWGFEYFGPSGKASIRSSQGAQSIDQTGTAWKSFECGALTHNGPITQGSATALKRGFTAMPETGLGTTRRAPSIQWRYSDAVAAGAPPQVGPVAEDLPDWMVTAPGTARVTEMRMVPGPDVAGEDGASVPGPDVAEEVVIDGPPREETVSLTSMIGTLWEAVRELDAELDELRREKGRPVPTRRTSQQLLADIRADRLPKRPRRAA